METLPPRDVDAVPRLRIAGLHVITDGAGIAEMAASAGAHVIQVRAKHLSDRELYGLCRDIVAICDAYGATCIVNDRVDVALAVGAHGTHLGADDLPVAAARAIAGPDHIIGGTARDPGRAADLVAAGASYVGVGPAYATTTKQGLPDPLGPAGIAAVARAVAAPVIAIGGIRSDRIPTLVDAGAAGVAVIGAVASAADPRVATKELLDALRRRSTNL